jgi:PIN domain nuclease of toxin-antitoxin system
MRLLLDTHVIVWAASGADRLDRRVTTLLTDARHELWMSAVSAWELAMLSDRGRLDLRPDLERWLAGAVAGLGLKEAPLTSAIALESRRLVVPTEDPADRFLAATARVHQCAIVTADVALRRVAGVRIVFCRRPKGRPRRQGHTPLASDLLPPRIPHHRHRPRRDY